MSENEQKKRWIDIIVHHLESCDMRKIKIVYYFVFGLVSK